MSFAPPAGIIAKPRCGFCTVQCSPRRANVPAPKSFTIRRKCCRCSRQSGWPAISCAANCSRRRCPNGSGHQERRSAPLPEAFKKKLLRISPAQIDRLLRPARVQHPKRGLSATRPGTLLRHAVPTRSGPPDTTRPGSVEADTVAHCDDSTEGDYVNSLTFTELFSGWTENRAIWNKSGEAVLVQLKELEQVVPYEMMDFHSDNGGEFLNWALHRHLTGRAVTLPWTRSRADRKSPTAPCEQKNCTHV